ncbi:hypothetical protein NL676_010703 [Syzygium grande]|nr:hypothetical protein NL676_010703 [Syzygium grande]
MIERNLSSWPSNADAESHPTWTPTTHIPPLLFQLISPERTCVIVLPCLKRENEKEKEKEKTTPMNSDDILAIAGPAVSSSKQKTPAGQSDG